MNLIPRLMFGCTAILVVAIAVAGQERRTDPVGDLTGRDAVGFRKDSVTKETLGERRAPANTPTTKQAIEDFMQLQKSNRRIQDLSRLQPPSLEAILVAAKDVSTRATRLKTSLALPSPPKESKTGITPATSIDALMNRIKELDANIKLFVTNPIFRQMTESGRDLPMEASVSLSKVIALSKVLEESAGKLR